MDRDGTLDDFLDPGGTDNNHDSDSDAGPKSSDETTDSHAASASRDNADNEVANTGHNVDETATDSESRPNGGSSATAPQAVEGATVTMRYRPGTTCEACGAVVERLWQEGDVLVCNDCTDW